MHWSRLLSFKDILNILLEAIDKKVANTLPLPLARISAKILQLLPRPILTEDQLRLLNMII